MSITERKLHYCLAINEALKQCLTDDPSLCVIGQGLKSPWYVGQTANGLIKQFGELRIMDTPVSENAVTGLAVGASICGARTVVVHPRMDFMMYALDPIINEAANWHYMSGGKMTAPVVFWGIINRGGEQAAQHSQALHSMFAHIPGLKVVAPSNAYDAKGLMAAAIKDDNPVVFVDERWLYYSECHVPEELYVVPIGKASIARAGKDVTIVASSYLTQEALKAADVLATKNEISAEILDLRTIKPFDLDLILHSVDKTGRMLVVDGSWKTCGISAEIIAAVAEKRAGKPLHLSRLALPDAPAPASRTLENEYYITAEKIVDSALNFARKV